MMNRISLRKKIVNLVNPVNPVEKNFVLFRVASWKNIFLKSIIDEVRTLCNLNGNQPPMNYTWV